MKAVLHRSTGLGNPKFEKIVLSEHALSLAVTDEIVTIRQVGGTNMVAAVRLGEKDYITFEQDVAQA